MKITIQKSWPLILVLIMSLALLKIVSVNSAQKTFKDISALKFKQLMYNNKTNYILDVRSAVEFKSGHIKWAKNIDFYAPDFKEQLDRLNKNKKYFVYCRSGRRSGIAMQIMKELGFKYVYNMLGGIKVWSALGFPLIE